ncbi:hypothetical protein ACVW0Y_001063 [Pseudomonas sp. TE3786]
MSLKPALFLHIQKTAGTTMVGLAQQHYGRENVVSHSDFVVRHGLFGADAFGSPEHVQLKSVADYQSLPFVSGHFGFDYAKPLMDGRYSFTFLRDPIDRILSFYYFCKAGDPKQLRIYALAQQLSLEEFLALGFTDPEVKAFIWNNQTWQLASGVGVSNWKATVAIPPEQLLASALENIEKFSYVGFKETFAKDRDAILRDLGIAIAQGDVVDNANEWGRLVHELSATSRNLLYGLTELDRRLYEAAWARKNASSRRFTEITQRFEKTAPSALTEAGIGPQRDYYLSLLQQCLTGTLYSDVSFAPFGSRSFDQSAREHGLDWPERAQTMVGDKRLANLRELIATALQERVPGDFIETGVWRGGSCILMRAILLAFGVTDRRVWVADSFAGLPPGDEGLYPADAGSDFHVYEQLAVSLETVKNNFRDYGLLDAQIEFLQGWFKDTLPSAPIQQLALIRLDGDMYESTMDGLVSLYPKLSQNGYVIVDDYHVVPACKLAVHDYFASLGINPPLIEIDGVGVYWKKTEPALQPAVPNAEPVADAELAAGLNAALQRLNQVAIRQLVQSMVKREIDLARYQTIEAEKDAAIERLIVQLQDQTQAVSLLHNSLSWRVTAPLRTLRDRFRKVGSGQ